MGRIQNAWMIAQANLPNVVSRDNENRAKMVTVPGTEGKFYDVIIRRNGILTTECLLSTGIGHRDCLGNNTSVCYHSLAALIKVAPESKCRVMAICKTRADAERRARIDGQVIEVKSRQSNKSMFLVIEKEP